MELCVSPGLLWWPEPLRAGGVDPVRATHPVRSWVVPDRHRAMPVVEIELWLTDREMPNFELHHDRADS